MSDYIPLSKTAHAHAGIVPSDFAFAVKHTTVPLVAEELPKVLPTLVIGFAASSRNGGFELVALQSLRTEENAYVHTNGRWLGGYLPAWYRAHPFGLRQDKHSQRLVVCVDEASPAFTAHAGENDVSLFDEAGELSPRARDTVAFLKNLNQATRTTRILVNQLEKAGVLAPWSPAKLPEGQSASVKLYHVDESALKQLDPTTLSRLATSGALSVAYTQLLSEHRLQGLAKLHRLRDQANTSAGDTPPDLDAMFGEDDDELGFDFD